VDEFEPQPGRFGVWLVSRADVTAWRRNCQLGEMGRRSRTLTDVECRFLGDPVFKTKRYLFGLDAYVRNKEGVTLTVMVVEPVGWLLEF
jgi:hypothetical protein